MDIHFRSFWRHGQVVRRGTANPLSPVQIWVSPGQIKKRIGIFTFSFLITNSYFFIGLNQEIQ